MELYDIDPIEKVLADVAAILYLKNMTESNIQIFMLDGALCKNLNHSKMTTAKLLEFKS